MLSKKKPVRRLTKKSFFFFFYRKNKGRKGSCSGSVPIDGGYSVNMYVKKSAFIRIHYWDFNFFKKNICWWWIYGIIYGRHFFSYGKKTLLFTPCYSFLYIEEAFDVHPLYLGLLFSIYLSSLSQDLCPSMEARTEFEREGRCIEEGGEMGYAWLPVCHSKDQSLLS